MHSPMQVSGKPFSKQTISTYVKPRLGPTAEMLKTRAPMEQKKTCVPLVKKSASEAEI